MEIASEYRFWLKDSNLEIAVIVSLAYGGPAPLGKKLLVPPEHKHEALSFWRHLKRAIHQYTKGSDKGGLKATILDDKIQWNTSVTVGDLNSYAVKELKADDHHPGWQRIYEFCQSWLVECGVATKRKFKTSTTDLNIVQTELNDIRSLVLSLGYELPVPLGKRTECAKRIVAWKPRVTDWGKETLTDLLGDRHKVANRLAQKHNYDPWWRGLDAEKLDPAVRHAKRTKVGANR